MSTATIEPAATHRAEIGKYLTFSIGKESYAIAVLKVREIIRLTPITSVPQMPTYIRGVINLRGKIIPVVDLRIKFGMSMPEETERTCIVVVQVHLPNEKRVAMGLIVDGVEEVIQLAANDMKNSDFGAKLDTEYILGMAKIKGAVKTILDIDRVVAADAIEMACHNVTG